MTTELDQPLPPGAPVLLLGKFGSLLTVETAAAYAGVPPSTIARACDHGEIATVHIGNARRIPETALAEFIQRRLDAHAAKRARRRSPERLLHNEAIAEGMRQYWARRRADEAREAEARRAASPAV